MPDKLQLAVVSQFGFNNYGNRLQSCAVLQLLRTRGIDAVSVALTNNVLLSIIKEYAKCIIPNKGLSHQKRYKRFRVFSKRYTPYRYVNSKVFSEGDSGFSGVVLGSDQIWYPDYIKGNSFGLHFFAPKFDKSKKIALAPSFGVSSLPEQMKEEYAKGLSSFDVLSVREEAGKSIIHEITGQDSSVLIDPTLAIDAVFWREIADGNLTPSRPFLLRYVLDDVPDSVNNQTEEYAKKHHLDIVNLMDKNSSYYSAGPAEFIDLIDKASYFVTNSFHGAAFAIMLHTPFCVTERVGSKLDDMSSRIDTLVKKLGCPTRMVSKFGGVLPSDSANWQQIEDSLAYERSKFNSYLDSELERCGFKAGQGPSNNSARSQRM